MYVKNLKNVPDGLQQCWMYEVSVNPTASAKKLVDLKQKRVISALDIEILKLLSMFDAAPAEYISRGLGHENTAVVEDRLQRLVGYHILNAFMLTDGAETKLKDDALLFYTLDAGALIILDHYTDVDVLNYRPESVIMTSTKVNKRLMTMDFYYKLKETLGNRLMTFAIDPVLACGQTKYIPKAYFTIATENGKKGYFLDVARTSEFYELDTVRLSGKLARCSSILNTNAWKKYFDGETAPTLLIYADTDESLKLCANITEANDMTDQTRFCTTVSLQKSLDNAFLKYQEGTVKAVKSKSFAKAQTK